MSRDKSNLFAAGLAAWLIAVGAESVAVGQGLAGLTRWEQGRSMRAGSNVGIQDDPYDGKNTMDRPHETHAG